MERPLMVPKSDLALRPFLMPSRRSLTAYQTTFPRATDTFATNLAGSELIRMCLFRPSRQCLLY
jgi:hypothetical protein